MHEILALHHNYLLFLLNPDAQVYLRVFIMLPYRWGPFVIRGGQVHYVSQGHTLAASLGDYHYLLDPLQLLSSEPKGNQVPLVVHSVPRVDTCDLLGGCGGLKEVNSEVSQPVHVGFYPNRLPTRSSEVNQYLLGFLGCLSEIVLETAPECVIHCAM
jgi:hypothetical protein